MRYQGSKTKMSKVIKTIVENNISNDEWYVEPFVGGCNSFSAIKHKKKVGSDTNKYVIALWKDIQKGTFIAPKVVTEMLYNDIKLDYEEQTGIYPDSLIGYVGFACSYGSGWWNGYAHYNEKKNEDHIKEARNGLINHVFNFNGLHDSLFLNVDYKDLILTESSFIYCDPPYQNTKKYVNDFNNKEFWTWCRTQVHNGHKVLISEYNAPDDFICIWSKEMQDGMGNSSNKKVEKLFIHVSQIPLFNLDSIKNKNKINLKFWKNENNF